MKYWMESEGLTVQSNCGVKVFWKSTEIESLMEGTSKRSEHKITRSPSFPLDGQQLGEQVDASVEICYSPALAESHPVGSRQVVEGPTEIYLRNHPPSGNPTLQVGNCVKACGVENLLDVDGGIPVKHAGHPVLRSAAGWLCPGLSHCLRT
jgi:hypothetical protein